MSGKVKNQHYVPKMYLKRFTADNNRFSVWNLMDDTIITRQRPENYAVKRYYYDANEAELRKALTELIKLRPYAEFNIDYNDEQFVEKALSRLESDVAKIIDAVCINHDALFDEQNMSKIIIFLHVLAYRSEKYRDLIESIKSQLETHINRLGVDPKQVKELELTAKENQLYQILGFAPLIETTVSLTENCNWYIGTVSGQMKLVISDNPAQGVFMGFNDICIPISGDKAIIIRTNDAGAPLASKDMPVGNEIKLSERSVIVYNSIQLSYANRFVFGDKNSLTALRGLQRISSIMHQKNDEQSVI